MDPADRELFERSLRHATGSHTGPALDAALDDLGWPDALAEDPATAVATLFELQGGANATSSALDRVLASVLAPAAGADPSEAAVVLPRLGRHGPPGAAAGPGAAVRGVGTALLRQRRVALLVVAAGGSHRVAGVAPGDLDLRPGRGLDPALGLIEVTGDGVLIPTGPADATSAWAEAVAAGQRALAHELVGAARAMLELARGHALERVQFGHPIGAFQAVRHRLADGLVAVESAAGALAAAWDDGSPRTAALAKAIAGRGARTVARHCQQVLGGIGFTTEHPFHHHVRRVLVLDQVLGSTDGLTRELGEDLLRTGRLPALLPL